jgi:hypothetical protein
MYKLPIEKSKGPWKKGKESDNMKRHIYLSNKVESSWKEQQKLIREGAPQNRIDIVTKKMRSAEAEIARLLDKK